MREKGREGVERKGNRKEAETEMWAFPVARCLPTPITQQLLLSLTNDTQAQRRRGKGLLTPEPSVSYHPLALEGGQVRKQGTQRVPASLKGLLGPAHTRGQACSEKSLGVLPPWRETSRWPSGQYQNFVAEAEKINCYI